MVFIMFWGLFPDINLTFDLLISKSNQHIYKSIHYICGRTWVKFPSLALEIWCSQGFRVTAWCDIDL